MIRSTLSVAIVLVATIGTAAEKNVPALRASSNDIINHRNLQIELGDDICPPLEDLFQNLVVCECDVEIDYPLVLSYSDIKCGRQFCDPLFGSSACADVTFATNVTLGPIAVGAAICLEDITVLGFPIPLGPFCIDYILSQESLDVDIPTRDRTNTKTKDKKTKHGKDKHTRSNNRRSTNVRSNVDSCIATMAGMTCNSCTPCDRRGGVQLDCTNAMRSFKTKECTKFRPYLGPGSQPNSTIPKIFYSKN